MVLPVKDEQVECRYVLTDETPKIAGGFTFACM